MTTAKTLLILLLTAAFCAPPPAEGGSIWAKAKSRARALHSDDTARKIGDTLTIVIEERTVIENETKRSMNKDTSRSAKTGGTVDLANVVGSVGKHIFDLPKLDLSSDSSTKFEGSANFDNDRSMLDKVTVAVQDVLPNGNLVVLGQRQREVEGDKQIIQVSGIVRPGDVDFYNSVPSSKVADFHVVYKSKGQEKRFSKPGWLARFLNIINPF